MSPICELSNWRKLSLDAGHNENLRHNGKSNFIRNNNFSLQYYVISLEKLAFPSNFELKFVETLDCKKFISFSYSILV
jgi:hypothetical protein